MRKRTRIIYILLLWLLLFVQLVVLFYYGNRKSGFHEDELYSYYSSNKTAGLFVNDREWTTGEAFDHELVVLPGEQFRYGVVKQMQSWDVHPPLYYDLLHTVCSLTPGIFSKWQGISVNLVGFVISFWLLAYASYLTAVYPLYKEEEVSAERERCLRTRGYLLAVTVCAAWGFGGAVISGVMFIRMYQWLTVFVLLCLCLHLRYLQTLQPVIGNVDEVRSLGAEADGRQKRSSLHGWGFFVPLGITVFLGFLTQYYYIIFHFFLGAGFCLYLCKEKQWKGLLAYVGTCAVSLGAALLCYPAALSHIFKGYRGTEAVGEFADASNTWERLSFFARLFDDYMLGGLMAAVVLILCLLVLTRWALRKRGRKAENVVTVPVVLMTVVAAGYFFTVAKTALLLGETSNRYELPVYGLLMLLLIYGLYMSVQGLTSCRMSAEATGRGDGADGQTVSGRKNSYAAIVAGCLSLVLIVLNLTGNKVFFLYEEERVMSEFIEEHIETPVIVFYNEASETHIWWLLDELCRYENIYFASLGCEEPLAASESFTEQLRELCGDGADPAEGGCKVVVYVADYDGRQERMTALLSDFLPETVESGAATSGESNTEAVTDSPEHPVDFMKIAQKNMWTVYEIDLKL